MTHANRWSPQQAECDTYLLYDFVTLRSGEIGDEAYLYGAGSG